MNIRLLLLQKRITQENNMKDSGGTNQNLIFILLLVMVGGVVVLYMTMRAPAEEDALAQAESAESASFYRDVVETINRINAIKEDENGGIQLNSAMFQDPQFRALRDGSVKIDPPTNYRNSNPFLPF
jgi:hypothetical protein